MIVNICSSGSSGSTLLSSVLGRHKDVFSSEELGMFSKPIFYEKFNILKIFYFFILKYGVSSLPYFEDCSILRNLNSYDLNRYDVGKMIKKSESFIGFVNQFESLNFKKTSKKIWAEKTPENIYTIKYMLSFFPNSKVIHIVRDPRDVVLSLMARGLNQEQSADVWLSSVASIQPYINRGNVIEVRYEDLVRNTKSELIRLCEFMNIEYNYQMMRVDADCNIKRKGFDTWNNNPNAAVSKSSLGKYKKSKICFENIFSMKVTKEFSLLQETEEFYLIDLMKKYGYDISGINFDLHKSKSKKPLYPQCKVGVRQKVINTLLGYHNFAPRVEL